jgi:SAM-dependent methyltransferase
MVLKRPFEELSYPRGKNMSTSSVNLLRSVFSTRYRFALGVLNKSEATFGSAWTREFDFVLASLFPDEDSLCAAAKGYTAFAFDSMRRQKVFNSTLLYENTSYAQAASEVYFNEEYMESEYLPGLLLSHFLWPHHYRQIQFFDSAFLSALSRSDNQVFAEIGVGTALYSRRILEKIESASGYAYDISPTSCRFAKRQVDAIQATDRYEILLQDILEKPMVPVSWIICVEVLEHLEDPVRFLRALHVSLRQDGKAFITAALNSAHVDHIYLYRETRDVELHLRSAGFVIEESYSANAYAPSEQGDPVPVAAAFIVSAS